jgi:EpsI family protein
LKKSSFGYLMTVLLLSATMAGYALSERRKPEFLAQPLETIDMEIAGWRMAGDEPLTPGVLDKLQLTSYVSRSYEKSGTQLGLFIAFYAQQRAGESMHSPKHCLPGSGWEIWKHDVALVPVRGGPIQINQYSIQNASRRMLVFYWYQSKGRIIRSEYMGKILLVKDALLDGRTAGSLVRITLPDTPSAAAEATSFASILIPQLERCFGETN